MKILELTLTAREPLVITSGSAESMAHTCLEYIPGSMLLGAFASTWIGKNAGNPDQSPVFQQLFLKGDVSWGCAYPLCGSQDSVPTPLSYKREKGTDALPVYGLPCDLDKAAVINALALPGDDEEAETRRAWVEKGGKSGQPPKFKKLNALFMQPQTLRQPAVHKVWNTRVALGEQRSAREGQLFGFSALASGMVFRAQIYCRTDEAAQNLELLLNGLKWIRVGHARSAGYGLARLEFAWLKEAEGQKQTAATHDIYLLSQYIPDPPWENPLANLLARLEELAGQKPRLLKAFLAYNQIEGFCGHWQKSRDSRTSIAQGGALRISFEREAALPPAFELGGGQLEGYGRILANPAFLKDVMPEIPRVADAEGKKPVAASPDLNAPFWGILRKRALMRAARRQAQTWIDLEKWQKFLADVSKLHQPSLTQVSNMLTLTPEEFDKMLDKTPGEQWRAAVASNPFGPGREHLDVIMRGVLAREAFLKDFPSVAEPVLPGGKARDEEFKDFKTKSHDLFRRELIRTWIKYSRSSQREGQ